MGTLNVLERPAEDNMFMALGDAMVGTGHIWVRSPGGFMNHDKRAVALHIRYAGTICTSLWSSPVIVRQSNWIESARMAGLHAGNIVSRLLRATNPS
ncbi:hypothetical protein BDQ94DRAFT_147922 [Aspergillus welwitschiae]|uniref:Uncharacterized protein n=1 Tax=Aspergillus welwitschiae TaxID=1341132 RepID=A0A3F3PVY4_9EURO|nr:hypothetical protein BDQ94DRAFT_147922 [Aspergillus welwitschiae]RDH31025.1 hypothetical protein BDQ94DRAFT_147922 [Aspergillus welwitschiae]